VWPQADVLDYFPHEMADFSRVARAGSEDEQLLGRLDRTRIPRHVAIIMDGNGRWAKERGLPRVEGHRAGVAAVSDVVEAAAQLGIEILTLYAFSVENWKRPRYEIWALMNLLKDYLKRELATLVDNGIRLQLLGRWRELEPSVVTELERALQETAGCQGMQLNIALNYSGRCEIVDACRQIVADWAGGEKVEIDEQTIGHYLYTSGQPDPDLLIRSSGELRVSNFLLWQIAYTEIWMTDVQWPDFRRDHLLRAILDFQSRDRRFGAVSDADDLPIADRGSA
jgi:undecaprenyl diphosphate synthase